MPIYEYFCRKCENRFEKLVASSAAKVQCDRCGQEVERQLSVFAAPPSSPASSCKLSGGCPSAGGHACGSGCCGGHRH